MLKIREALPIDVSGIFSLIKEIAEYEKLTHLVTGSEELLAKYLFDSDFKVASVLLAEWESHLIGYALYFFNFSSFLTRPGLYLEDLYVKPEMRGKGVGKALFEILKDIARKKDCGRIEWSVLNWNTPSIEFYKNSLGAAPMDEWTVYRLTEF
jgi:GNAT superfamily N-acetyltransferase